MEVTVLRLLLSLICVLLLWLLIPLYQNYLQVRDVGLPVHFAPFGGRLNPIWFALEPRLGPVVKRLSNLGGPFSILRFIDYTVGDWFFTTRRSPRNPHVRFGPAFFVVSPGGIQLAVADAAAIDHVLARRKQFVKNETYYKALNILGPNLISSNGETWAQHRRITTPPFNERNSSLVWRESVRQADGMLRGWLRKAQAGVATISDDTGALTMNVFMAAGFGKRYGVEGETPASGGRDEMISYRDALKSVMEDITMAIVSSILADILPPRILPRSILDMKAAVRCIEDSIHKMIADERAGLCEKSEERDNLMSALIKASEREAIGQSNGLSDQEIIGNLFIYILAGYDTTTNTLAYALVMLATHTGAQKWVREEIVSVFGGVDNQEEWDYEEAFPRLKRCMAVMVSDLLHFTCSPWVSLDF